MATEIRVPTLGESVSEATIGRWFKKAGDAVKADEPLVELETDKVTVEVPAPAGGVLSEIVVRDGETVGVGALLGSIEARAGEVRSGEVRSGDVRSGENGKAPPAPTPAPRMDPVAPTGAPDQKTDTARAINAGPEEPQPKPQPSAPTPTPAPQKSVASAQAPSVRRISEESGIDAGTVTGSGKDGRVTKGDMLAAAAPRAEQPAPPPEAPPSAPAPASAPQPSPPPVQMRGPESPDEAVREERVKMTRLRQTIARRLKDAQNTAAMLTTFNDVDMHAIMQLRTDYKDMFEKKHGVKLGFMSFFVKACVQALKELPAVNGEIDGTDIVFKNYYNIGVAVGTEKGLVVPVVRDADRLSLAGIEKAIAALGKKARDGKLDMDDLQGGTFSITNGGVYGSLMSTPILNAPQSGILGMHRIEQRPVALKGQVVVRPMMYLALSYDHRIVDGREAVTFLVRVKEALEDPTRLVLDL